MEHPCALMCISTVINKGPARVCVILEGAVDVGVVYYRAYLRKRQADTCMICRRGLGRPAPGIVSDKVVSVPTR